MPPLTWRNSMTAWHKNLLNDPGCFAELSAPKPLSEKELQALCELLTADQLEALNDIASRGGPDVEAIARLRSKSMI